MTKTRFPALVSISVALALGPFVSALAAGAPTTETIVMVRHAEKPMDDLGQLNCQGLNRALALPAVIGKQFGRPDAIFAPNPSEEVTVEGVKYDYVRPLATIEPTAIAFGLPVHASIGFSHIDDLGKELEAAAFASSLVIVAWEHKQIAPLANRLMVDFGGEAKVEKWSGDDFDSIYVIRITRSDGTAKAIFEHGHEGLDGQSDTCPGQPTPNNPVH